MPDVGPNGSAYTDVEPPPFTTIAWRMWHVGASPNAPWPPADVPDGPAFVEAYMNPSRAERGRRPRRRQRRTSSAPTGQRSRDRVLRFTDDELQAPLGPVAGPYKAAPLVGLLLHVVDEMIHHGAEIGVLRDLYAHRPLT